MPALIKLEVKLQHSPMLAEYINGEKYSSKPQHAWSPAAADRRPITTPCLWFYMSSFLPFACVLDSASEASHCSNWEWCQLTVVGPIFLGITLLCLSSGKHCYYKDVPLLQPDQLNYGSKRRSEHLFELNLSCCLLPLFLFTCLTRFIPGSLVDDRSL